MTAGPTVNKSRGGPWGAHLTVGPTVNGLAAGVPGGALGGPFDNGSHCQRAHNGRPRGPWGAHLTVGPTVNRSRGGPPCGQGEAPLLWSPVPPVDKGNRHPAPPPSGPPPPVDRGKYTPAPPSGSPVVPHVDRGATQDKTAMHLQGSRPLGHGASPVVERKGRAGELSQHIDIVPATAQWPHRVTAVIF